MIPVCEPTLSGNEKQYVMDCLDTGWISSNGKYIDLFESAFAALCGARHCVGCCNGTAALHLALAALHIGPGHEVIVPSFTMIATGNAVVYTGATPVFVDAAPDTWTLDPAGVAQAVTDRTRAILVMHTYGHPVDMDPILAIARQAGAAVIEDAAQAHGAEYKGRVCGNLGDLAAFSFYGNKLLTMGEGGAVTTSNPDLDARLRSLRNHCFGTPRFLHAEIGFNYRLTNIQAALGLAQVERAHVLTAARRRNAELYQDALGGIPGIITPPEAPWAKNAYWMYGIVLEDSFALSRDQTMAALRELGVDSRAFFHPLHKQPCYEKIVRTPGPLPVSEWLGARGLYLPSSSHLTPDQIRTVASALRRIAESGP